MALGFYKDGRWLYSGGDEGSVRLWDMRSHGFSKLFLSHLNSISRSPGSAKEYEAKEPVAAMCIHPNQVR